MQDAKRAQSSGETGVVQAPSKRDWGALAVLAASLGVVVLDGTIVGVALPKIIGDLSLTLADAQWVNSLYAVIVGALLLASGSASDRLGRRRLLVVGMIIFMAGSAVAGVAGSAAALLSGRAVQAVGAAGIMPATLSTVNALFRGKYRAAAFGIWGGNLRSRRYRSPAGRSANRVGVLALDLLRESAPGRATRTICPQSCSSNQGRDRRAFRRAWLRAFQPGAR